MLSFLFVAISLFGCMTTSFKYTIKDEQVFADAAEGKGLVYFYRKTRRAGGMPIEVYMDGKPVGVTKGGTYFFFYLPTGNHNIRAQAGGNVGQLNLNVENRSTYYIEQGFTFTGVITLKMVGSEEGRKKMKELKFIETQLP